jgi:Flp pilus assembly protein CpaB
MTTRTASGTDGFAPELDAPSRPRIERLPRLPGARAIVGGLLVAVAGVGTLATWQRASGAPDHAYVVASRAILPGETITADHLQLVPIDLPESLAAAAFGDMDAVAERVALAPIGEGELIQISQVSDPGQAVAVAEVSLALERDRAVDGRLRSGDLVDVFVTFDDRTDLIADGVRVVAVNDGGAAFSAASQITVTLALEDADPRTDLVHAARAGDVTLVRSTHAPSPGTDG